MPTRTRQQRCGTHMYQYVDLMGWGKPVWACGKGCGHYLPKNVQHSINLTKSICWYCHDEIKTNEDIVKHAIELHGGLIICTECHEREVLNKVKSLQAQLQEATDFEVIQDLENKLDALGAYAFSTPDDFGEAEKPIQKLMNPILEGQRIKARKKEIENKLETLEKELEAMDANDARRGEWELQIIEQKELLLD